MSLPRLVFWITLLSIFAMAARVSMDTDTWWHLRAGEWIFENRAILQHDEFSYTRYGDSWNYPGWIVQVPMFLIFRYLGPGGLNIWTAALVTAAFAFSWFTLRGGYFFKAFLLILAAAASSVFWSARPHMVTFVLASATLFVLEKSASNERFRQGIIFWLPVIMLLWVNSHGGFVVGFILWGIYWLAEQSAWIFNRTAREKYARIARQPAYFFTGSDFRLTLAGLLMLAAACINPAGIQMLNYPFQTVGIAALREYIQEWQSPDFHSLSLQPFLWLFFLGFAAVGLSRRVISLADFLLFTVFAMLGFMAGRNIALFTITAPLVISRHLDPVLSTISPTIFGAARLDATPIRHRQWLNLALLGMISFAVFSKTILVFPADKNMQEFQKFLPVKAVEALNRESLDGQLFNSYNWGGYLLWSSPQHPVFIDGRTDLYDDEVIQEWLQVVQVKNGWEHVLDDYNVNLVINETGSKLTDKLQQSGQWSQVYQDSVATVFARKIPLD